MNKAWLCTPEENWGTATTCGTKSMHFNPAPPACTTLQVCGECESLRAEAHGLEREMAACGDTASFQVSTHGQCSTCIAVGPVLGLSVPLVRHLLELLIVCSPPSLCPCPLPNQLHTLAY
jgi:hypothetical protein